MARDIKQIAHEMGTQIIGHSPDTGGGTFGAARLPQVVHALRERLQPSRGPRPGRPTSKDWSLCSKVPMSSATRNKLRRLAQQMSTTERKVSPMQVAAQLLEEAVAVCPAD
jgi:hypothetical protein